MSYSASTGAAAVVFLVHVCNSVCPSVKLSYTLSSMTHGCWSLFCCCVSTKVTKKQLSNFQYKAWKSYPRVLFGRFFELFKDSSVIRFRFAIVLLSFCLHFENSAKSKPMRGVKKWRFSVQLLNQNKVQANKNCDGFQENSRNPDPWPDNLGG